MENPAVSGTVKTREAASKAWANATFRGVEGLVLPSFRAGYDSIDEAGIRHDVRAGIAQGYFSLFSSTPGLERGEYRRLLEIVSDEARGRIATSAVVGAATEEMNRELLADAERAGCTHVLLTIRSGPASAEDLYAGYKRLIESTPLGIVLYAYRSAAFRALHPSGIPLDVFDRLADLPNVAAVKLTQALDAATAFAFCRRLSDRILVGTADLGMLMVLAQTFPIRWTGQWLTDCVQSPEQRNVVDIVDSLANGRLDEALARYWQIAPAYERFAALQRPYLLRGAHPWNHMKYYQWCVGGNGGLLRPGPDVEPPPDADDKQSIQEAYRNAGISLRDRDDATFACGRAQSEAR